MQPCLPRAIKQITRHGNALRLGCARRVQTRSSSTESGHEWSTPLARQLAQAITTTGPISVASYMRQCLTSDLGGYYTSQIATEKDQFGAKGDFVTSPEISQIFGELVGIWMIAEWMSQGKPSTGVYVMEVGPGRGTLMADMLRTMKNFPDFMKAVEAIYLVEASPRLRKAQHSLLCGTHELTRTDVGYESRNANGLRVVWTEDIRFIPRIGEQTPFIVAHEFFDALPIHVFQACAPAPQPEGDTIQTPTGPIPAPRRLPRAATQHQWRELLVSPKPPHRLKPGEPEFEMSVAKASTPHAMYLPETSARFQALKNTTGATIEISPDSQAYVREFVERIGGSNPAAPPKTTPARTAGAVAPKHEPERITRTRPAGAALIMDYGQAANIPTNSLRGIRSHKRVSPFEAPGATDVSADVDFLGLAEVAINGSPGVEVHGPVDQARFLTAMGIESRAAQLMKRAIDKERGGGRGVTGTDRTQLKEMAERIETGWRRLVDTSPQGMGRLYQVMAILPHEPPRDTSARRRPVGFGGDISM